MKNIKYVVQYKSLIKKWVVINVQTKLAQSAWARKVDAAAAARDLNNPIINYVV
jgi:hypothetical protein